MISLPTRELLDLGFKNQELQKVTYFISAINPFFLNYNLLIDLCAGSGLCSLGFLYNGLVKQSLMVDKKIPLRFHKLQKLFDKYEIEYIEKSIYEKLDLSTEKSFIVAIHPCSELGDKIIEIGLENEISFAIMPCCHKNQNLKYHLQNPPDSRLMLYKEKADYFDLVRQRYIIENKRKCYWQEIPKKITQKNHILISPA
ncbi:hypothetical protein J4403_01275 [Candidatus Woesearchaeota archaeon]|nr:hypothetical protein [Candidatus Woesearchaeota archaeon]